jgi:pimeloyl-ACP methyl ester carboxylesterase
MCRIWRTRENVPSALVKPPSPKRLRARARIAILVGAAIVVLGWRPVAVHVRAASLLARFGDASRGASPDVAEELSPVPALAGGSGPRARIYVPQGSSRGAIVLVPGVHHLGIDEPRLVRFARAASSTGVTVLTPEISALIDYRIEGASVDEIGAAARALHERVGQPVGVMGMSFAGGLALLAASDSRFAPDVAFVVAVGAHDDLARVSRFFATNEIPRPDGSIAHLAAHPYGPLVLVYDRLEDFFSPADLPIARDALRLWLWEDKAPARVRAEALPPDARAKLMALFDGKIDSIAPALLAEIDAHPDAMRAASPHGRLAGLRAPVFLLHGAGDSVIPATETLWLATDVPKGLLRDELVSPALVHVELEGEPGAADKWALVHLMAEVLEAASPGSFAF